MRRRNFVSILGGAVAWPLVARAQPAARPVIGYLSSKGPGAEVGIVAAARQGLAQHGFVEGRNLVIEFRWSDGDYGRLAGLAAELVGRKVDLLMTSGLPATLAARDATATLPIVFRLAIDPVAFGLAQSLGRPGGNLTGVTMLFDPLTPKKLQLLHELVPGSSSVGFLINANNQNAASHRDHAEQAARSLGLQLTEVSAGTVPELDAAFAAAKKAGAGTLLVGDDPFFDTSSGELIAAAARHAIPTMYYVRDFTAMGGLISYGPNFDEMARQAGDTAGRILKGDKPANLPIGQPTRIELVINRKTATALGLTVPPSILARADEVIE
jgi:putative tryptophan/tyrosine transport system substrate-binding protein